MRLLLISTVSAFFRQRAGMLFVVLGILFGFMSGREHYAFALFFLKDANGMYYLLGIWLIYTCLCGHFILKLWSLPEYGFIYGTRLWSSFTRVRRYAFMALGFLQPIIYYGIYITAIARQDGILEMIWPLFFYYPFLTGLLVCVAEWRVWHPKVFRITAKRQVRWPFARPASWLYWSLEWLLRERALTILLCKMGAAAAVLATLLYYSTDVYDLRLPAIGMSLGYLLNIGISYEVYLWESDVWLWARSLPMGMKKRIFRTLLIHAIIIVPETALAVKQGVLSFTEILQLYMLGLALLTLFHTYLYKKKGLLEDTMQPVLFGFIAVTLLVLYKIPLVLIACLALLLSCYKFPRWYRGY